MKYYVSAFFALCLTASAQISAIDALKPLVSGAVWLDIFGGPSGAVIYPQYAWKAKTFIGTFNGYGFVEVAPHEPFFTNHLVVYTLPVARWFSLQTETGGKPNAAPRVGFFQLGPRVNIHEVFPGLKKLLDHLFAAVLPRFVGIRANNLLLAGGTNKFRVARGLEVSVEGYRRFFASGRPDYAEYWLLLHPAKTKPVSFAAFVLQDGSRVSTAFGIRVTP